MRVPVQRLGPPLLCLSPQVFEKFSWVVAERFEHVLPNLVEFVEGRVSFHGSHLEVLRVARDDDPLNGPYRGWVWKSCWCPPGSVPG